MNTKLMVVKLGSSSLTGGDGSLRPDKIGGYVEQMARLAQEGCRVILVTSGAVAAGFGRLGYAHRPKGIADKQACAAVGQSLLMEEYAQQFARFGLPCGQLLLTQDDFADRRRYKNAFNALTALLSRGAVPIINENDTVAVEELKIGDNDTLSAQVAAMMHASVLALLTDVDGLYTANPAKDPSAKHIDLVEEITDEIARAAGGAGSERGTGGMRTKIKAAALATSAGVEVVICSAKEPENLFLAAEGRAKGTRFLPRGGALHNRQQWLAFYAMAAGNLYVDEGAAQAITQRGKSLLPRGVVAAEGDFKAGDVVNVFMRGSHEYLGRGIVAYAREDLLRAMQADKDAEVDVIHRDNWVKAV